MTTNPALFADDYVYHVEFEEAQRRLLVAALESREGLPTWTEDESDLLAMLRDMPTMEHEHPGIIHGLCF